jgi:Protein of unknown function (DUF2934)
LLSEKEESSSVEAAYGLGHWLKEERMAKQATANAVSTTGKTRKRAVKKTAVSETAVSNTAGIVTQAPELAMSELSHHEIAQHAYDLYLARGAHDGGAEGDWLRAEHELRAQRG